MAPKGFTGKIHGKPPDWWTNGNKWSVCIWQHFYSRTVWFTMKIVGLTPAKSCSQVRPGASSSDSLTSAKPDSEREELWSFTASWAFQWATLAVAPLFFKRQLRTCFDDREVRLCITLSFWWVYSFILFCLHPLWYCNVNQGQVSSMWLSSFMCHFS